MEDVNVVLKRYQPEIDRLEAEYDLRFEMELASFKMTFGELCDAMTNEQRYWFDKGWDMAQDGHSFIQKESDEECEVLHNIYMSALQEANSELLTT